jgi:hypothetical protein
VSDPLPVSVVFGTLDAGPAEHASATAPVTPDTPLIHLDGLRSCGRCDRDGAVTMGE